jgi:hypothetical protein
LLIKEIPAKGKYCDNRLQPLQCGEIYYMEYEGVGYTYAISIVIILIN